MADPAARVEVSVVLPCLNEEDAVGRVVEEAWRGIAATGRAGEVVVVDNGSSDRSADAAEAAGARVVHEARPGYGSAYLAGFAAARGELIVMADADGTYDVGDLRPFVDALEANDVVIGSRRRGRIHSGAMPWAHRWIGNPVLTAVLNLFFGAKISDAHCGLRAVRRSVLPVLRLQATGMEFASEMVLKAAKRGLRMTEVPIDYHPRVGESKLKSFRDAWRHVRFMLVHAPTFLFLVPGGVLLVLGLIVLFALAGGPVTVFGREWQLHAMILASTATLVGAQIVQLGLFARTYAVLYLDEREPALERLWARVRLEHGLMLGGAVFVAGGVILTAIFLEWAAGGFGVLGRTHESLLGLTLVGLGTQTIFAAFFLSVLGLRWRSQEEAERRERQVQEDRSPGLVA